MKIEIFTLRSEKLEEGKQGINEFLKGKKVKIMTQTMYTTPYDGRRDYLNVYYVITILYE